MKRRGPETRLAGLAVVVGLATACASPVGISVASPQAIHRYLTRNALSADEPSGFSLIELRRYDLLDAFHDEPDTALARLHELALQRDFPPEALFALSELSFLRAEESNERGRYAAAALYAYAFLFPEEERESLDPLDPRSRIAADLYNRALTSAFRRKPDGTLVAASDATIELPFGGFSGSLGEAPDLGGYAIESLQPVAELEVRGLRNRYRRPGVGAPLAARLKPTPASEAQPVPLGPSARLPLTAVVRTESPLAQLRAGQLTARVDLFSTLDVDSVEIGGHEVALEAEPTAALAAGLSESRFWEREIGLFLGDALGVRGSASLLALRPYRAGRIPVVFVHGTASSPGRWADMVNDLVADARLRHRYAFWFFRYDSGNPIAYSAWQLRDALARAVQRADPDGSDPCLRDMVVLGHSQGGLLAKLTAIDSGDAFWRRLSDQPLEQTRLSDDEKQLARNTLFVTPLPFVRRVLFLATPHRGSYLAGPQLVRRLARWLVRLPSDVVRAGASLASLSPGGLAPGEGIPTSIDNMSPGHRFIRALARIPISPGVTAHSIISVEGDGPLDSASDGVVEYRSAHVDGVESELVVRSPHSGMQASPETIEEVRRILLEHAATSTCPDPTAGASGRPAQ